MCRLLGIILLLLMPIMLQLYASLAFLPHIPDNYSCALELINAYTLQVGRLQFDTPFSFMFFRFKFCLSFIENISLRVHSCTRNFIQFSIKESKGKVHPCTGT